MQAWQVYLDEFRSRTSRAGALRQDGHAGLAGDRELVLAAAHDAYQRASDRMVAAHGWSDEHTLVVMRGFNAAVQHWLQAGAGDWDALAAELQRREAEVRDGFPDERGEVHRGA